MASDTPPSTTDALRLITAALAFLDADAAFGAQDDRTVRAKARLRSAVEGLVVTDEADRRPPLRVLQGGAFPP